MPAQKTIRENVLLSICGEGDVLHFKSDAPIWGTMTLSKVKPIPGGKLQIKYRSGTSTTGRIQKTDMPGDIRVERERVPVTKQDFAILARAEESKARMVCQRHGLKPDEASKSGEPNWTLFTEEAIIERRRLEAEKQRETETARRAELLDLMPLSTDEIIGDLRASGIFPEAMTAVMERMLASTPAYGSAAVGAILSSGGLLKRVD